MSKEIYTHKFSDGLSKEQQDSIRQSVAPKEGDTKRVFVSFGESQKDKITSFLGILLRVTFCYNFIYMQKTNELVFLAIVFLLYDFFCGYGVFEYAWELLPRKFQGMEEITNE